MMTIRTISKYLKEMRARIRKSLRGENGQTLVEYALIISLLVIVTVAVMLQMGTSLKGLYCTIESQVSRTGTGS
jgi:Flp pilus assembly pilin Flp